jgi:hypothetical protein
MSYHIKLKNGLVPKKILKLFIYDNNPSMTIIKELTANSELEVIFLSSEYIFKQDL